MAERACSVPVQWSRRPVACGLTINHRRSKGNLAYRSETLLDQRRQNSNTGAWAWNSIIDGGDQITRCGYSQLDADGDVWIATLETRLAAPLLASMVLIG
jgi:hypothetical protein